MLSRVVKSIIHHQNNIVKPVIHMQFPQLDIFQFPTKPIANHHHILSFSPLTPSHRLPTYRPPTFHQLPASRGLAAAASPPLPAPHLPTTHSPPVHDHRPPLPEFWERGQCDITSQDSEVIARSPSHTLPSISHLPSLSTPVHSCRFVDSPPAIVKQTPLGTNQAPAVLRRCGPGTSP